MEEAFTEEALTEDVLANAGLVCSGSLQLPTGTGLLAEDLQVLSSFGAVTPNAAGKFNIPMAEGTNPQFVVAIDSETDHSLLLGYMDPATRRTCPSLLRKYGFGACFFESADDGDYDRAAPRVYRRN